MMVKCFLSDLAPAFFERFGRRQHLHQGFGRAAGFGDGDEMRLLEIEALQRRVPARRDRDCRGIPRTARVVFAQRRQRLAAQAASRRCPAPRRSSCP